MYKRQRLNAEIERKMDFVRRFGAKATKARQAGSRQKMAKKLEKELEGFRPEAKRKELSFKWPEPPKADKTILSVADLAFAFPDGVSPVSYTNLDVYKRKDRLWVPFSPCGHRAHVFPSIASGYAIPVWPPIPALPVTLRIASPCQLPASRPAPGVHPRKNWSLSLGTYNPCLLYTSRCV